MLSRPYISKTTKELEQIFKENTKDKDILICLKKELLHRQRSKAVALLDKVNKQLESLNQLSLPIEKPKAPTPSTQPSQPPTPQKRSFWKRLLKLFRW